MKKYTRILVACDLHGSSQALENLPIWEEELKTDFTLLGGDITHFGEPNTYCLDLVSRLNQPIYAILGNCDPWKIAEDLTEAGIEHLHQKRIEVGSQTIVGFGVEVPRHLLEEPFEEDVNQKLLPILDEICILLVHYPPKNILDNTTSGRHIGSSALWQAVQEKKPRLVISGHVHEARGIEKIENITFLNPGAARSGYGALIEIGEDNSLKIEMLAKNRES